MTFTRTRNTTKYTAIKELSESNTGYSISALCDFAGITRAAYYKWLNHVNSDNDNLNEKIADIISQIHDEHPDMGYRRIRDTLSHDYHIDVNTDIDYFLIHQANKLIVDRVVKKLHLPVEKVPYDLEEFGNLGGASIPSLMVTRIAEALRSNATTKMLCSSFGLGLSWGTMLLTTNNVVVPNLIEI